MKNSYHESVMVDEVIQGLHVKKLAKYIDATLGNGGHAEEILKRGGRVLGIDLDPAMIRIVQKRLGENINFKAVHGNFVNIDVLAERNDFKKVSGILFDLGVTNVHLKDLVRGFSFENQDADLDMRIDPKSQGVTARDLLNVLREDQLRQMFEVTVDPGSAKWLTGRVLHSRQAKPLEKVADMLEICKGLRIKPGLNEATLPFLALRIAVNSELDNLKEALPKAFGLLEKGGRLVVISFHSGEDAIVKSFFRNVGEKGAKVLTEKPLQAETSEVLENRRARSARLRILQK